MKEFNLEEAKAGQPVCTRDGKTARIICFDMKGDYPIVALILDEPDYEECLVYFSDGRLTNDRITDDDLMMASIRHEGWVNVFRGKHGCYVDREIWDSEEKAKAVGKEFTEYITSVKIEWEK